MIRLSTVLRRVAMSSAAAALSCGSFLGCEAHPAPVVPSRVAAVTSATPSILANRQGLADDHPFLKGTRALADCDLGHEAKTRPNPANPRGELIVCVEDTGWYGELGRLVEGGTVDDRKAAIVSLLRLVHDRDVRFRRAGGFALAFLGGIRTDREADDDPELVNVLLSAAEAERDPIAGDSLGMLSSDVDSDLPGVLEAQERLVNANPTDELRVTLLSRILFNESMLVGTQSKSFHSLVDFVAATGTDHPDPKVRSQALISLSILPDEFKQRSCEVWKRSLHDTELAVVDTGDVQLGRAAVPDGLRNRLHHGP